MARLLILFLIFSCLALSTSTSLSTNGKRSRTIGLPFVQAEQPFKYDDKGRRDPLFPLVDKNGRYLLSAEISSSSVELNLSGILWDPQGKSSALINNEIVAIGESIAGFTIESIDKDSIAVSRDGKAYTIRLSEEEKGEE